MVLGSLNYLGPCSPLLCLETVALVRLWALWSMIVDRNIVLGLDMVHVFGS